MMPAAARDSAAVAVAGARAAGAAAECPAMAREAPSATEISRASVAVRAPAGGDRYKGSRRPPPFCRVNARHFSASRSCPAACRMFFTVSPSAAACTHASEWAASARRGRRHHGTSARSPTSKGTDSHLETLNSGEGYSLKQCHASHASRAVSPSLRH
jgi:hypothetical protein